MFGFVHPSKSFKNVEVAECLISPFPRVSISISYLKKSAFPNDRDTHFLLPYFLLPRWGGVFMFQSAYFFGFSLCVSLVTIFPVSLFLFQSPACGVFVFSFSFFSFQSPLYIAICISSFIFVCGPYWGPFFFQSSYFVFSFLVCFQSPPWWWGRRRCGRSGGRAGGLGAIMAALCSIFCSKMCFNVAFKKLCSNKNCLL